MALVLALGAATFFLRQDNWSFVLNTTGIKVPEGAVVGKVEHPTEVLYSGTIDLKSASNVNAFIVMNKLTPASVHAEADGFIHKGTIIYDVPKERYVDTYVLYGRSKFYAWEFVLDSVGAEVRFEVLGPDMAGDVP